VRDGVRRQPANRSHSVTQQQASGNGGLLIRNLPLVFTALWPAHRPNRTAAPGRSGLAGSQSGRWLSALETDGSRQKVVRRFPLEKQLNRDRRQPQDLALLHTVLI
jgi:hypothetical protein